MKKKNKMLLFLLSTNNSWNFYFQLSFSLVFSSSGFFVFFSFNWKQELDYYSSILLCLSSDGTTVEKKNDKMSSNAAPVKIEFELRLITCQHSYE